MNKKTLYIAFFLSLFFQSFLFANEKEKILTKLINTKSLEFNFDQKTNEKNEGGTCYLNFPGLLRCEYNDSKKKQLIINKSRLAITQKRYNKTLFYSVKKSPFIKILNKDFLKELIRTSNLQYVNNQIKLTGLSDTEKITILFDKNNFNLVGWEITDQFQNKIVFLIKILSVNKSYDLSFFEIPS